MRAWKLATDRYRATTGRNLDEDLVARGMDERVVSALSPTWTSFRGAGGDRAIATYNTSLARYYGDKPRPARNVAAASGKPMEWGTMRRIMETV